MAQNITDPSVAIQNVQITDPSMPTRKVKKRKFKILDDEAIRQKFEIPHDTETIYTDGACTENGKYRAKAGIGVFFSPNDPRNISARLPGRQQTNQRAELFAVLKALETLHINRTSYAKKNVVILSDSTYVVNGLSKWVISWERCGWVTALGNEVVSKDVFKRAKDMLGALAGSGIFVRFRHVLGHRGVWGNEEADKLARWGAQLPQIIDPQWSGDFDDPYLDDIIKEMQEYDDDRLDEIIAEMEGM